MKSLLGCFFFVLFGFFPFLFCVVVCFCVVDVNMHGSAPMQKFVQNFLLFFLCELNARAVGASAREFS